MFCLLQSDVDRASAVHKSCVFDSPHVVSELPTASRFTASLDPWLYFASIIMVSVR